MNCPISHCTENRETPCSIIDKTESCPVPFGWSLIFHPTGCLQGALLLCVFTQLLRPSLKRAHFAPFISLKVIVCFEELDPEAIFDIWRWNGTNCPRPPIGQTQPHLLFASKDWTSFRSCSFFLMWCGNFLVLWWKLQGENLKWK